MKITLICVGSIKENYLKEAINEYKKRLTKKTLEAKKLNLDQKLEKKCLRTLHIY